MRIVVFADEIRPREHLSGLIELTQQSAEFIDLILISSNPIDLVAPESSPDRSFSFCCTSSVIVVSKYICSADLVIGLPQKYVVFRIFSRLGLLRFIPLYIGPGKITKAIGFYKHPEKAEKQALKTYVKFLLLNTHYLANDRFDALYNAAALGYPLARIVTALLPKYFYINERLIAGQKKDRPKGILIAPTHRWGNRIPQLTELLAAGKEFDELQSLNGKFFYSKHPDTPEILLHRDVHSFSGNWNEIDIVVTDYSSIGEDFINSGGKKLIYFVPDRIEFEKNQGSGLFFSDSLRRGEVCVQKKELASKLREFLDKPNDDIVVKLSHPHYFSNLIKACQN